MHSYKAGDLPESNSAVPQSPPPQKACKPSSAGNLPLVSSTDYPCKWNVHSANLYIPGPLWNPRLSIQTAKAQQSTWKYAKCIIALVVKCLAWSHNLSLIISFLSPLLGHRSCMRRTWVVKLGVHIEFNMVVPPKITLVRKKPNSWLGRPCQFPPASKNALYFLRFFTSLKNSQQIQWICKLPSKKKRKISL